MKSSVQYVTEVKHELTPAASERKSSDISDWANCRTIGTTSISNSPASKHYTR